MNNYDSLSELISAYECAYWLLWDMGRSDAKAEAFNWMTRSM